MTLELDAPRAAVARPLGLRAAAVLAIVVGVVLGGVSWWADQLSWFGIPEASPEYIAFGVMQVFGNGPTLWLIGAFVVGLAAGRIRAGAMLATASLLLAVGVYYGLIIAPVPGRARTSARRRWRGQPSPSSPVRRWASPARWSHEQPVLAG